MKLIFKTSKNRMCFVRVPNYFDHEKIPEMLKKINYELETEKVVEDSVLLHGDDWLTNDEYKQLDTHGRITKALTEIKV